MWWSAISASASRGRCRRHPEPLREALGSPARLWQTRQVRWTATDVVAATGGELRSGDAGTALEGLGTDSRRPVAGSWWVAVRAARDGHDFVADALRAGAGGLVLEAGHPATEALAGDPAPRAAVVAVADTLRALLDLGRAARARLVGPVVGITGSVGKTSTKDMLAAALAGRWRTAASEQSYNNELGVPLTLCNAAGDTEVAVVEMGTRGFGHIRLLCDLARPTIGVVTAVAAVHTELLGSLDGVFRAKCELPEALPPEGIAVLNADDQRVAAMAPVTRASVLRYSASGSAGADVVASAVALGEDLRPRFVLQSPWGEAQVCLAARGAHQVANALGAAAAALSCDTPLEVVVAGLESARTSRWRMELARSRSGATIVNDAYNSNPASLVAALRALASMPARRRVAVLGAMAELGPEGPHEHLAAAQVATQLGIELLAVGTTAYGVDPVAGGSVEPERVVEAIGAFAEGDAVLVKGSRVVGLERVAAALVET